jgi:hypothetical protein
MSFSETLLLPNSGIRKWGIADAPSGSAAKIYAYEVDGLGNQLLDFDDPNWPSLVSIPLLGWQGYDHTIYQATRTRLLSKINQYWFEGQHFRGMGSPHTEYGMAWALGTLSEALTATDPEERAEKLRLLLKLQCGDGLMHESINVDVPARCTRRWFEVRKRITLLCYCSRVLLLGYIVCDFDMTQCATHGGAFASMGCVTRQIAVIYYFFSCAFNTPNDAVGEFVSSHCGRAIDGRRLRPSGGNVASSTHSSTGTERCRGSNS